MVSSDFCSSVSVTKSGELKVYIKKSHVNCIVNVYILGEQSPKDCKLCPIYI